MPATVQALAVVFGVSACLLAGCSAGYGPTASTQPFAASCPSWVLGRGDETFTGDFSSHHNDTHIDDRVGGGALASDGHPLDQLQYDFHWRGSPGGASQHAGVGVEDGQLTLRFYREDDGTPLSAFRLEEGLQSARSSWTFAPGVQSNFTLQVDLATPTDAARPTGVHTTWDFQRDLDGNPATPSDAAMAYHVELLYRTCNADGSVANAPAGAPSRTLAAFIRA